MKRKISRRERGIAMVYVAMALLPLIGLLALAMQWAQMTVMQAALQDYVDARAIAAIQDRFGNFTEPVDLAAFVTDETDPGTDPQCGGWDHAARSFDTASPCASSVGVPAHRVEHTINVPVLFAPFSTLVGGDASSDLTASATSFIPRREVVLVQDISGSLGSLTPSQNALDQVVDTMQGHDLPGDEIGLVTFGSDALVDSAIAPLTTNETGLRNAIDNLDSSASGRRGSTCTSGGILRGRQQLQPLDAEHEAAPLMIVVTDGVPTSNCEGISGSPASSAVDQGEISCAAGIDVWAIAVGSPDMDAIEDLACDPDQVIQVTNPQGVENAVLQILTQIPVRLVD